MILVAGFRSRQSQHDHLYKVPFSVPSLHVYGDTDKVIQKGTVNSEILARISFSRTGFDIFVKLKICDYGIIYLHLTVFSK